MASLLSTNTVHLIEFGDIWIADKNIFTIKVWEDIFDKCVKVEIQSNEGAICVLDERFSTKQEAKNHVLNLLLGN